MATHPGCIATTKPIPSANVQRNPGLILRAMPEGSLLLASPPPDVTLRGRRLTMGATSVTLPAEHGRSTHLSVLRLPQGVLLLSTQSDRVLDTPQSLEGTPSLHHAIDYVATSGDITRVHDGDGAASAIIAGPHLLIQVDLATYVLDPDVPRFDSRRRLPDSLALHVLLRPIVCAPLM